jgi:hypothetical protein
MNKQFRGLGEIYRKEIEQESQFSIEKKEHSVPSKVFEQNLLPEVHTEQYVELENFSEEFYGENLLKLKKEVGNSLDEELRKIVRRLNSEEKNQIKKENLASDGFKSNQSKSFYFPEQGILNTRNEVRKDHVESVEFKIFESKIIHFFDCLVNVKSYQNFCDNTIIDLDLLGREEDEKVRFLESLFSEKDNQLACLNCLNQKTLDKEEELKNKIL